MEAQFESGDVIARIRFCEAHYLEHPRDSARFSGYGGSGRCHFAGCDLRAAMRERVFTKQTGELYDIQSGEGG